MNRMHSFLTSTIIAFVLLQGCAWNEPKVAGLPDVIDYNWHVRPILSENCMKCHGPDEEARGAELRLDLSSSAFAELKEAPGRYAIIPGAPDRSELIRRITAEDPEVRMPPQSEHKQLTPLEIETLRAWIRQGAEYKEHWSFISPERPEVPGRSRSDDGGNEIDAFVRRRLERDGLSPSPEADRETLINRVYLTLTGLPPTVDEVDAFVNDPDPDAYESLVDQLLGSDRYAEHMAGYWMDIARWSETDGFLDDQHDRTLWPWRDWVIHAFADNMPFDQFGAWQLSGDLLPNATRDQILATSFVRLGNRTTENGAIDEEYKAEYMIERTDNALGVAFLGLTLGCARCHDHKYDPISQRDYYSLGAFFNSTDEPGFYPPGYSGIQAGPTLSWPDTEAQGHVQTAAAKLKSREVAYHAAMTEARESAMIRADGILSGPRPALAALLDKSLAASVKAYYPFDTIRNYSATEMPEPRQKDPPPPELITLKGGFGGPPAPNNAKSNRPRTVRLPTGYLDDQVSFSDSATKGVTPAVLQEPILRDGVRGQALYFNETNRGFLGRDVGWYDRTHPFTLDLWFYAAERYEHMVPVINHRDGDNAGGAGYRLHLEDGRLRFYLAHSRPANMIAVTTAKEFPLRDWTHITITYDGSSTANGTKIYLNGEPEELIIDHDSLTRSSLPKGYPSLVGGIDGPAVGSYFREKAPIGSMLDEFRVFDKALHPIEVAYLHNPDAVTSLDAKTLRPKVTQLLVSQDRGVAAALTALSEARESENKIVSVIPQVLVMGDAPEPVPTYVLNRGVYTNPGERVYPRGPEAVFAWDESLPENRLGLAKWLFQPDHPLTSRVFVNRIWQMHFGRGIVETSEDFGAQGSIPTHPELLDWLSVDFVESGWDIKRLHRMIVTSATYRQSSDETTDLLQMDPRNDLLARGPRWRMSAEMVRDTALAVSGLLVNQVGGESVHPYQPEGIWNSLNSFYSYPAPDEVPADEHHRRSLYSFVKRNASHPAMEIFDFPERKVSTARRSQSNTPLQALVLMNDPQFVEAYRTLAESTLKKFTAPEERLRWLYRAGARRSPTARELEVLAEYYQSQLAYFEAASDEARKLLSVGVTKADADVDAADLAALTNVVGVIMNSPDAYTVQ